LAGRRHINLSNVESVRKYLSKIINQRIRAEINSETARDVGYLLKIWLDTIKAEETEINVKELITRIKKHEELDKHRLNYEDFRKY